jgi:hypothetical protein
MRKPAVLGRPVCRHLHNWHNSHRKLAGGNLMSITGKCMCGGVQFDCDEIGSAGYCHCEDCRRCTGSAFNISVRCEKDAFHIRSGRLGSFTTVGDSGFELTRYFCIDCGSPIYTSSPRDPSIVFIKAGVLDDPTVVKPTLEAWVQSKVDWSQISVGLNSFKKGRGNAQ